MKTVILDSFTTNPGDLDWEDIEDICDLTVYEHTPQEKIVERAIDAEAVITNKTVLDRFVIGGLPKLKYVGLLSDRNNVIDLEAARGRGVVVSNVPAYNTMSVVQLVFAHLLNYTHRLDLHSESVRSGEWCQSRDFCYWKSPLIELHGLTMGIIGFGEIGKQVAKVACCFGMQVIADADAGEVAGCAHVKSMSHDDVFRRSDVLSLHCPLNSKTEKLVNAERLEMMKPTAFLINTGRGGLLDEEAVAEALDTGRLAGVGLDVLSSEPPKPSNPLLTAPNCWISPHIGWATRAARLRLVQGATENFRAFLKGNPINVVT